MVPGANRKPSPRSWCGDSARRTGRVFGETGVRPAARRARRAGASRSRERRQRSRAATGVRVEGVLAAGPCQCPDPAGRPSRPGRCADRRWRSNPPGTDGVLRRCRRRRESRLPPTPIRQRRWSRWSPPPQRCPWRRRRRGSGRRTAAAAARPMFGVATAASGSSPTRHKPYPKSPATTAARTRRCATDASSVHATERGCLSVRGGVSHTAARPVSPPVRQRVHQAWMRP